MGELVKLLLIIVLIYAFGGLLSFFPYILGVFHNILLFPLHFLEYNIYPVSVLPYFILTGSIVFIIAFFVIRLLNKE